MNAVTSFASPAGRSCRRLMRESESRTSRALLVLPHPALRATFSRWEKGMLQEGDIA
jgi:hypothetical protein